MYNILVKVYKIELLNFCESKNEKHQYSNLRLSISRQISYTGTLH